MKSPDSHAPYLAVLFVALVAVVTYLPVLTQPLIEDDYHNILLAREYGPVEKWLSAPADEVNRVRMTTWVMTAYIEKLFVVPPPAAFYTFSIILHVLNTLLVYLLGAWRLIGYRVSIWAALFFAVYEGHQEAVMWYSACNELLLFVFGLLAFNCWLRFLEPGRFKWIWYSGAVASFLLALLSKESSVIIVPLMALPLIAERIRWKEFLPLLPFALLAAVYAYLIMETRRTSFRFYDGSFDLDAPFWITWSKSMFALFWFWGLLALGVLAYYRASVRLAVWSLVFCGISFVPYMFVTYMTRVPSRQTYLASAGLAIIVGAAFYELYRRIDTQKLKLGFSALVVIVMAVNIGYLWTKKRKQFLARAEPTEQLIRTASAADGPVFVECFPRPQVVADSAVDVALGKPTGTLKWNVPADQIPVDAVRVCIREK